MSKNKKSKKVQRTELQQVVGRQRLADQYAAGIWTEFEKLADRTQLEQEAFFLELIGDGVISRLPDGDKAIA